MYIYFLYSEKNLIINIQNYYIVEINNVYHYIRKSLSPCLCKTGITKNIHHILITQKIKQTKYNIIFSINIVLLRNFSNLHNSFYN